MNVCRHGAEWGCEICDPETYYAEKRERQARENCEFAVVAPQPAYKFDFLNEREQNVLRQMSEQKDMSEEAVMRQALRMYQLVDMHLSAGSKIVFRKEDGTLVDPLNVGPKLAPNE